MAFVRYDLRTAVCNEFGYSACPERLVDSFGAVTMAAFAAAVKIDSFAYLPVQDLGNAFSTFKAQNYGVGQSGRIKKALKKATILSAAFSSAAAVAVFIFAEPLMRIFVSASETEVIAAGVRYFHIEGVFYAGIWISLPISY